MIRRYLLPMLAVLPELLHAQAKMTPELLWSLKRVSADGISKDGSHVYFSSKQIDYKTEKSDIIDYGANVKDGSVEKFDVQGKSIFQREKNVWYASGDKHIYKSTNEGNTWEKFDDLPENANDIWVSPDGQHIAYAKDVLITPTLGSDIYADLPRTSAHIYTDLNDRHWDKWNNGKCSHIFVMTHKKDDAHDIMANEPYDAPQKPFGSMEDLAWTPDGKGLIYVSKKKAGKEYATSTNTDIYYYNLSSQITSNWTAGMMGYDTQPIFSPDGKRMAWLSMKQDGFEADKNDICIMDFSKTVVTRMNITEDWDGTVNNFAWDNSGTKILFTAPWRGTEQLFEVNVPRKLEPSVKGGKQASDAPKVKEITTGQFDITSIVGINGNTVVVTRTDINHATEIYSVDRKNGEMKQISRENNDAYSNLHMSKTELRMVRTTDGKKMGVWVIYPPDFDPAKKYPTLLYCQGGPQSALTQFYSFRWNFQLMAAQGYIIVAPNRRGMPGWGVKWNADISKDWGGQPMRDYLAAIDDVSKEEYVDKDRLGCVGASYGGYSVYMLAGMHEKRFKTFIAHDGLFDLKSWYGTTEELWFANWDINGPYWKKPTPEGYARFNPSNFVDKWTAPIMVIQGGIDFRVPIEQGHEAFQAAQLRGLKSKLLYLPNENHWVLHPQNAIAWQREFFKWLQETL